MSKIVTFSGQVVDLLSFDKSNVNINDISHSLSLTCRFVGHIKYHYSVAYHSIIVSYLCKKENALYGLLHDASEAYIQDIPSPLKNSYIFKEYKELEKHFTKQIYNHFNLFEDEPDDVKSADKLCFFIEQRQLTNVRVDNFDSSLDKILEEFPIARISKKTPEEVEKMFLERFYELTKV